MAGRNIKFAKMKHLLLILLLTMASLFSFAERAPYKMDELLFGSRLIAHVKITSNTNQSFKVRVLDILHHDRTGIVIGDYLTVSNDFFIICPPSFPIEYAQEHREALAFLTFHKGKWYLKNDQIAFLDEDKAKVRFSTEGYDVEATIAEWKLELSQYFKEFKKDKNGKIIHTTEPTQALVNSKSSLIALQYVSMYYGIRIKAEKHPLLTANDIIYLSPKTYTGEQLKDTNRIHEFLDPPPVNDSLMHVLNKKLKALYLEKYPENPTISVEFKVFYHLIIEKDGSVSQVKILRSFNPKMDAVIKAFYLDKNLTLPIPRNENNWPVRCKQILMFRMDVSGY